MSRLGVGLRLLVGFILIALTSPALADTDPPTAPALRLDVGMHTADINSLAVDASGELVATASDDKTVRLWHAADGALIATLRVPIAEGAEGELNAVAFAPDGKHIIAGGATGFSWGPGFAVYLFDTAHQTMIGRLAGLPTAIMALAYAPGGGAFAVGLAKTGGIRLYDSGGKLLAEDDSYGDRVSDIAFDATNRFATVSYDGKIRLYDAAGKRIAVAPVPGGARPSSIAFSPSGKFLAVGYDDASRVDVLAADTLALHLSRNSKDLGDGALSAVGWAKDGTLFAAGSVRNRDNAVVVRRWIGENFSTASDVVVGRDLVTQLVTLPSGGIAFATADPAWGTIDAAGRVAYRHDRVTNDFRVMNERRFDASSDGLTVEFSPAGPGNPVLRFNLRDRSLRRLSAAEAALRGPAQKIPSARIDGLNTSTPVIAGQKITLPPLELARSALVLPDRILLGTDYDLRSYDRAGREIGPPQGLSGAAWAITATENGRIAVAALGDGTIRWYALAGTAPPVEVATMFSHADGRRWVMWTPQGFFDHADSGGKELVGYQLNRGKNEAPQWIGFAQLYRAFYAPDLVLASVTGAGTAAIGQRIGAIGDVRTWLRTGGLPRVDLESYCVANAAGPETCTVVNLGTMLKVASAAPNGASPAYVNVVFPPGTGEISLRYRIIDHGAGIGPIDLFLNDRNSGRQSAAEVSRSLRAVTGAAGEKTMEGERTFKLDGGVNRIQLRVYNQAEQAYAVSDPVSFLAPANPNVTAAKSPTLPRLFILAAAVDRYRAPAPALKLAVPDAKAFVAAIRQGAKPLFSQVDAHELYDEDTTVAGIDKALDDIANKATADDMLLVYLAGHGEQVNNEYYFITQEFVLPDTHDDAAIDKAIVAGGMSGGDLVTHLGKIAAENGFLFLDTCHSAAVRLDTGPARLNQESGRYILVAAQSDRSALDSYDGQHGVFAYAVLEGLGGKARQVQSGPVNNIDLGFFVSSRVVQLAHEKNYDQSSSFKISAEDARRFAIVEPP